MSSIDQLANRLAPHYSHFNVSGRLLFTGHSHQAWPDVALEGLKESYAVAAKQAGNKWEMAFEKAEVLRSYLRDYYDDPDGYYCLAENTHLLLVAWLSALDIRNKPKVITTTGEFHSMSRQLRRLEEEGLEVHMIDAESETMAEEAERLADDKTCAIMMSRVYFKSGLINRHIPEIARLARRKNIPFLMDDYHGTNVVPVSLREENLEDCYLLTGGYKYLQWGEGNCFLRFPKDSDLRPAITGWFASFSTLNQPGSDTPVHYDKGNQRFATGTYDPASQYRAARVVEFFRDQKLTPEVLQQQYRGQVALLKELFLQHDFNPATIRLRHDRPPEENGGFLALQSPYARELQAGLLRRGVLTDARGDVLRIGPAPYITGSQIEQAMEHLAACIKKNEKSL